MIASAERKLTNVETSRENQIIAMAPGNIVLPPSLNLSDFADIIFPSDNEWDVPTLDVRMQADALALPFDGWGTKARQAAGKGQLGTYHFYVDDYRFNALWKSPFKLINSGCVCAVEPNFSVDLQSPKAYILWTIYKKRWMNKYWQSKGIYTIVDVAVPPEHMELNFLGVPQGWKAFAMRGFTRRIDAIVTNYQAICDRYGREDLMVVIYGGGKDVQKFCKSNGLIHMPENSDLVRGRIKSESEEKES